MNSIDVSKFLLEINAVSIVRDNNFFTWVSGIKSPIYCDNRLTISYPNVRDKIAESFVEMIKRDYDDVDIIAGTATAGIPHAAWVAQKMEKSMIYVRSGAKAHGKGNQIEGVLKKGDKVVLIEDLLSTGGSSLNAVEAIKSAGGEVLKVYGIFNYNFSDLTKKFEEANMKYETITDYETLLPIAVDMGYVDKGNLELLMKWSKNPRIFTE